MNFNELFHSLILYLKECIESEQFLDEFRVKGHFVRKRKLTISKMVMFLLFYNKTTLDNKLRCLREYLPELEMPSVSKQALSKARKGIRFELFQELFNITAEFYYKNAPDRKLWKDKYAVFAIDGSDHEVPSSQENFTEFGKCHDDKSPDYFWSMSLVSVLHDVTNDIIIDAIMEKMYYGERELAVRHLSRLTDIGQRENSVVLFDRGYFSTDVFQECVNSDCLCVMRLKNTSTLCRLEGNDVTTTIEAPDRTKMACRVLKVLLSTGETEYLITNIMDKDISSKEFGELYFNRWGVEKKYRETKYSWEIEEFSGCTPLAVRQDFYITMLYVNLAAIIKNGADEIIDKTANTRNVYRYQARRTYAVGCVAGQLLKWLIRSITLTAVDDLLLDVSKKRSQIQPNRTRKRKRRTRAKKHHNNQKTSI